MKSITIHQIDSDLAQLIQKEAKRLDWSLNKTIKHLVQRGLDRPKQRGRRVDEFVGLWSAAEAKAIEGKLKDMEKIDGETGE